LNRCRDTRHAGLAAIDGRLQAAHLHSLGKDRAGKSCRLFWPARVANTAALGIAITKSHSTRDDVSVIHVAALKVIEIIQAGELPRALLFCKADETGCLCPKPEATDQTCWAFA
jgi:hypothetical protein